jgi:hypothetical protein
MNKELIDILDYELTNQERYEWINLVSDRDMYKLGIWLLMNLIPETNQLINRRSALRNILEQYHYHTSWSDKQKEFVGYSIIDLWPDRRIENDPNYAL